MNKNADAVVKTVEQLFASAPALPVNAREAIVKITPIIAIVFGILGVLGALAGFGLLTAFAPFAILGGGVPSYGNGFISALFWLVSSVLLLAAYPGTKARKMNGWNLLFWSEVVSLIGSLVSLSILSGIVGALISFYLLFQIKSYYK